MASAVFTRSRRAFGSERGQQQRQLHVLRRGQHRHQIVELEDEADIGGAQRGEFALGNLSMRLPSKAISPALGLSMPPSRLSSVVLPEPDGPMIGDEILARNRHFQMLEDRHRLFAARHSACYVFEANHRLRVTASLL